MKIVKNPIANSVVYNRIDTIKITNAYPIVEVYVFAPFEI